MRTLPLRHIVCPVDLSGRFGSSLGWALAIARLRGAELRALHVVPGEGAMGSAGLGSYERLELMHGLRESIVRIDASHDLVGGAVRQGDPATEILQFARSSHADLIVMGAPAADRPERPVGPVASVVIARSKCPVLTVPARAADARTRSGAFSRIVCGVDPTPSSVSVIRQALSLAWETGGRLTYACAITDHRAHAISQTRDALMAALPGEASEWCDVDVVVTTGTPGQDLLTLAGERHAELVVVGPPRRSTSTAHAVLARSRCPVLVTHSARPLPWPAGQPARPADTQFGRR